MRAADDDTPSLPEDPAALRTLLLETLAQIGTLAAERDALASQNERLQHLLLKLKRRQFGTKSERLPEDQLLLAFEEIEATLVGNAAKAGRISPTLRDSQAKRRHAGRGRLPAYLPRIEVVLAPEATSCPCCAGPLVEIGVDAAERLDVIPDQFRVVVTKRPTRACRACPGVALQEAAPARLIEGACRARRPSPTSWSRATPITCRCIASRRSWRGRASRSAARCWLTGPARVRRRSSPWCGACARSCSAWRGCLPTRPQCRSSTPDAARRRRATSGDRARRPRLGRVGPAGGGVPRRAGPQRRACEGAAGGRRGHPPMRREFIELARGKTAPIMHSTGFFVP
jgi:hypothetical protein